MGGTMLGQGPKECEREVSNERGEASLMENTLYAFTI